jgi:hypothetical protein
MHGYIAMKYIYDSDCDQNDCAGIALAFADLLRTIPSPIASPGPMGGGPITSRFFSSHQSFIQLQILEAR